MRIGPAPLTPTTPPPPRRAPDGGAAAVASAEASRRGDGERRPAQEQQQTQRLQALRNRDREVRAHELAHQAAGGRYAGSASFETVRGPDGRRYAVGGEVSIDTSPADTPEQTLRKMEVVERAALAPAQPSAQDRQVAAEAAATARQARAELARRDDGGPRDGEYLARGGRSGERISGEAPGAAAFREVAALGEPEFLSRGGRLDLRA